MSSKEKYPNQLVIKKITYDKSQSVVVNSSAKNKSEIKKVSTNEELNIPNFMSNQEINFGKKQKPEPIQIEDRNSIE